MTYLFVIAFAILNTLSISKKEELIVFKKNQKILLEPAALKWLKAEAIPAWQLEIEGVTNIATIKKPYSFYKGKVGKGKLIFIIKDAKVQKIKLTPEMILKIFGKETEEEPDAFEVMNLVGTNGETDIAYCSCAGATLNKEGDNCFLYDDSGFIKCDGECSGQLSGEKCGITVVDFTPGMPPKKIRSH